MKPATNPSNSSSQAHVKAAQARRRVQGELGRAVRHIPVPHDHWARLHHAQNRLKMRNVDLKLKNPNA